MFATAIVYVTSKPVVTGSGESVLVITRSAAEQSFNGELLLRGGLPAFKVGVVKSPWLLFVSVQPFDFLSADLVALKAATGAVSEQLALP